MLDEVRENDFPEEDRLLELDIPAAPVALADRLIPDDTMQIDLVDMVPACSLTPVLSFSATCQRSCYRISFLHRPRVSPDRVAVVVQEEVKNKFEVDGGSWMGCSQLDQHQSQTTGRTLVTKKAEGGAQGAEDYVLTGPVKGGSLPVRMSAGLNIEIAEGKRRPETVGTSYECSALQAAFQLQYQCPGLHTEVAVIVSLLLVLVCRMVVYLTAVDAMAASQDLREQLVGKEQTDEGKGD